MKKIVVFGLIMLAFGAVLVLSGCDDDEDNGTILQPGDPDSPVFEMFGSEFEGVDEITGMMFMMSFEFMDSTMSQPDPRVALSTDEGYSFSWSSGVSAWICIYELDDDYDEMIYHVVDTLRFFEGSSQVQYPDPEAITRITHAYWLELQGYGSSSTDSGDGHMAVTLTRQNMSDTLIVNGTGNLTGHHEYTDIEETDTTECASDLDFDFTLSNLRFFGEHLRDNEGELYCPFTGSLVYTGSVDLACTGANEATLGGTWTVSESFSNGTITIVVNNATNTWTITEDCDAGQPEVSPEFDSLLVEYLYEGPDMYMKSFQVLELTGLLFDHMTQVPAKIGMGEALGIEEEMVLDEINSYTYSNGWHIFDFTAYVIEDYEYDTTYISAVDSFQTRNDGSAVENPTGLDQLDEFWERIHGSWEQSDGHRDGTVHHRIDVTIQSVEPETVFVLDGSIADTTNWTEEGIDVEIDHSQTVSDLTVTLDGDSDCPTAGTMSNTTKLTGTAQGKGDDYFLINGTWIVNATVNANNTITISFDGPVIDWTTTVTCGGDNSPRSFVNGQLPLMY